VIQIFALVMPLPINHREPAVKSADSQFWTIHRLGSQSDIPPDAYLYVLVCLFYIVILTGRFDLISMQGILPSIEGLIV